MRHEAKTASKAAPHTYGVGARLKSPPSPELERFFSEVYLSGVDRIYFDAGMLVNLAHVLMLAEQGIVSVSDSRALLRSFLDIMDGGLEALEIDPSVGDFLPNIEMAIRSRLGPRVGGSMHTGRSRGDYYATVSRMRVRSTLLESLGQINSARRSLIELAEAHLDTVMPGYTHLQHAQPITLGHYLSSYALSLQRDVERAKDAYMRLNLSPLGLGIISTTPHPIDRLRTAALLGFDGLITNARDLTDKDYALEYLAVAAMASNHLHKLATDVYEWCTSEFNLVRVSDVDAMTSSIMPQKRNPVVLEHVRADTASIHGHMIHGFSLAKGSPAHNIEQSLIDKPCIDALRTLGVSSVTLTSVLVRAEFNRAAMAASVASGWAQATDLADTITEKSELSFREAHDLVGALVTKSEANGLAPSQVGATQIAEAAEMANVSAPELTDVEIQIALDPRHAIQRRAHVGGPAPKEVERQLIEFEETLESDEGWLQTMRARQKEQRQRLIAAAEQEAAAGE